MIERFITAIALWYMKSSLTLEDILALVVYGLIAIVALTMLVTGIAGPYVSLGLLGFTALLAYFDLWVRRR